jgi:hypothetical protein
MVAQVDIPFPPWRGWYRAPRHGRRQARAGRNHHVAAVGAREASAIWLRQALPIQTNSTRFLRGWNHSFSRNSACTRESAVSSGWNVATRCGPAPPAPDRPRSAPAPGPAAVDAPDDRRADEHRLQLARARCASRIRLGVEHHHAAVDLPAVGVALHGDIHQPQALLRRVGDLGGHQDGAGAGAEHRLAPAELPASSNRFRSAAA